MAKANRELTVAELERLLQSKKSKLETALKTRDRLRKELTKVEKRIQELQGTPRATGKRRRKSKKRARNKTPLPTVVEDILGKGRKGLTVAELVDKVLATGYKSNSKNFRNVLYQCLYNSEKFQHDSKTGTYRLKKQKRAASGSRGNGAAASKGVDK